MTGLDGDALQDLQAKLRNAVAVVGARPHCDAALWQGIGDLVNESSTPEMRQLKQQTVVALLAAAPALSPTHLAVITAMVNHSGTAEGRRGKLEAVANLVQVCPNLAPDTLQAVADFVNEPCTLAGLQQKLQALPAIAAHHGGLMPLSYESWPPTSTWRTPWSSGSEGSMQRLAGPGAGGGYRGLHQRK